MVICGHGMAVESVRIIIEVSGEAPLEIDLEPGSYVLGREEACELFIENDGISRQHARLTVSESGVAAEDLGSSNGSFLDSEPISEAVLLTPDTTLVLGADAIKIRLDSRAEAAVSAPEPASTIPPSAAIATEPEPAAPTEVNLFDANYAVRSEIARGGMGAVLEADDQNTGRTVAIKKMLAEGNASEESKHRFLQEARVMGHLEHPNIVPMHELALDEAGMPYYTMKRIQGTDLQDVLTRIKNGDAETIAAYPLRTLLGIFLKVCDAMAFAHSKGVIHRDLKPENIMLGEFGEVLVADWGLAKILPQTPLAFLHMAVEEGTEVTEDQVSEEGSFRTMEGSVMGTPNFMAPEQAEGNTREIDRLSDIFSLGGILYSILTLRPPVLGKTVNEVLENMKSGYIAPPVLYNKVKSAKLIGRGKRAEEEVHLRHCPNQLVPESLSRVAMHAMKLERRERYQKVQHLQKDIEAWQLGYATTAEEANLWRQIVLFVSRNKAATIVGCLVALIGTTMIGWSIFAAQKARAAMTEMKTAVPLIEGELQKTVNTGEFDRALARLDSLVLLMPDEPDYRVKRAQILQSMLQFDKAAEEFATAGALAGDAEKYVDDITFSRDLMAKTGTNGLDDRSFEQFVNRLDREERFAEARFHRSRRIARGREQMSEIRPKVLKLVDEKAALLISATFAAAGKSGGSLSVPPTPDAHWDFEFDARDRVGELDLEVLPGAKVENGLLHLREKNAGAMTELLTDGLDEYSIEVWADMEPGEEQGLNLIRVNAGPHQDVLKYNLRGESRWAFQWRRSGNNRAAIQEAETSGLIQYVMTVGRDAVRVYFDGTNNVLQNASPRYRDDFLAFEPETARITFGHSVPQNQRFFKGGIAEARLFHRAITAAEVDALRRSNPLHYEESGLASHLDPKGRQRLTAIEGELESVTAQVKALNRLVGAETSDAMLRSYRQLLRENGAPQFAQDSLSFRTDGRLFLGIGNRKVSSIEWLKGVPLEYLTAHGNPITDISPLRGMPLDELRIDGTKVARLDPLLGMKLTRIKANHTPISDISALRGMPLIYAQLNHTRISDLSPLKGAPLEHLQVQITSVTNLSALRGMPLKYLDVGGCEEIPDLTPLESMPLVNLKMWDLHKATNLNVLEGKQLQRFHGGNMRSATGWEVLAGQPIQDLQLGLTPFTNYSILEGMDLKVIGLEATKGTDFSVFQTMSPKTVLLERTLIRDLSQIGGTNHTLIDLRNTRIVDLSPLAGRTIDELWLPRCDQIRDVRPLLQCRIKRLVAPPNTGPNLAALKQHPTLQQITWNLSNYQFWRRPQDRWGSVPSKEQFWQEWDQGKQKP